MIEKVQTIYECEYCKTQHLDKKWMELHEVICPLNPKNQPCSTCSHQILGIGCAKNVNMEAVNNSKVKCLFYQEGIPKNLFDADFADDFDPNSF